MHGIASAAAARSPSAAAGGDRLRAIAYGLLAMPLAFAALPLYVHLPRLYGEFVGLSLAAVGLVLLLARIGDALIDPLIGLWSDRGPARQQLIVGALPVFVAGFVALLNPPAVGGSEASWLPMVWLAVTLTVTTIAFGIVSIAYQAWAVELGADSAQRTRLVGSREGFTIAGVVLASILPTVLAADLAGGLSRLSMLFLPLLVVAALITLYAGRTSVSSVLLPAMGPSATAGPVARPGWADLRRGLDDAGFRRLLLIFVFNGIAAALPSTLVLFFVADVLQAERMSGVFLAVYFLAGIAALPLWLALANRIGRVRAWLLAMGVAMVGFAWAPFLGAGDVLPFAIVCVLSGLALGADLALPAALLADLSAAASDRAGRASHGVYMGWWNLVAKLNFALAAGIALPLLQGFGYAPATGAGVSALAIAYGGLPLLFKLLALGLLWRWRDTLEKPA